MFRSFVRSCVSRTAFPCLRSAVCLGRQIVFDQLNGLRKSIEDNYVKKDLYDQAMSFYNDKNDEKFKGMLAIMTTQFENVEEKIDDLKNLINEKINGKHG